MPDKGLGEYLSPAQEEMAYLEMLEIEAASWAKDYYLDYVEYVHRGQWKPAKHLELICAELQKIIDEPDGGHRIMIFLPPRHGKTQSVTECFPSFFLGHFPNERVMAVSYGDSLAQSFGKKNRQKINEFGPNMFGISVSKQKSSMTNFDIDGHTGGMLSMGIGGSATGYGAKLLIIDDVVKNREEAQSQAYRDKIWGEWQNTFRTRLHPGASVILIMCLTGDTPILMADGTEKALRDIRIGDAVATYQNGELAVSVVQNWKNQGSDLVFSIRMESGVVVKGNARHPFLVERNGYTEWVRLKNLKVGDKIVRAQPLGEHGKELCAQKKGAINPQNVKGIATPITVNTVGQVGIDPRPQIKSPDDKRELNTGMELTLLNTMLCSPHKTEGAPYAENYPVKMCERIGEENFASTMTTPQEKCEDSCVMTVTSQLGMEKQKKNYSLPLSMFEITHDSIVEIIESGYEDVFDIQIDSTENFIANGLVSHNTRWHEDDLAGRLLNPEYGEVDDWTVIKLPALAEENDLLGRQEGEALWPEHGFDNDWALKTKGEVGTQTWNALYQQRPAPAEGAMIKREWFKFYEEVPTNFDLLLQSWDLSFKDSVGSDFVSGMVMGNVGANIYLLPDISYGRMDFPTTLDAIRKLTARNPKAHLKLIEDKANGPAVIAMLRKEIRGIIPITPKGSKVARVSAVSPLMEAGNVFLPSPKICSWVEDFIEECAAFPNGTHDDRVDSLSQGLQRFMYAREKKAKIKDRDEFLHRNTSNIDDVYRGGEPSDSYTRFGMK